MDDPLKGRLVRLAAIADADIPTVAAWHADGAFLRQLDAEVAYPRTEAQLRERLVAKGQTGRDYFFAVRALADDAMVGYIGLNGILWHHGTTWIEMAVAPAAQGRGYGGDALATALRFAFAELGLRKVQLTVFADNPRAIALYEKTGFQREGVYREFLLRDGRPVDMLLYGLHRREWAP